MEGNFSESYLGLPSVLRGSWRLGREMGTFPSGRKHRAARLVASIPAETVLQGRRGKRTSQGHRQGSFVKVGPKQNE